MMKHQWRKFAPIGLYLALVAVLVSFGLYVVRREFDLYLQISLGVFILGLATFVILDPDRVRIALTGRQARYGSNALLLTIAFLGILVVVNYFVFQNSHRWDLTEDKTNTLAQETLDTLATLPGEVTVQAFFTPERSSEYARGMLDDYKFNSNGKLSYEFIDPLTDPVSAQAAEITYDGSVVFRMGDRKEVVTSVTEQEFTGALVRLISGEQKVLYFLTGHGELSTEESGDQGFSQAKKVLQSKNYVIKDLNLLSAEGVPDDASGVVIAGPIYPLQTSEVAMISDYLAGGGDLILMQDSPIFTEFGDQTDYLAEYLKDSWGIVLGQDLVVDQTSFLGAMAPVGVANQNHPITQKIQGIATAFPTARSVETIESSSGAVTTILITTANNESWAETDLNALVAGSEVSYDPETDLIGPVPIAVVAENNVTHARVAVYGDVNFAMNANYTFFGNGDLFIGTVDWAVGQEDLITLTPKTPTQRYLLPPQPYLMNLILLFVVIVLPGAVLVTGVVVWFQKRRRG
jgi:ABC-type uncharacterized transport system involved in gliding motility auxiliary subunit